MREMRHLRTWLVATLAVLVSAAWEPSVAWAEVPLARLVAPADGAVLIAGELAWLAWEAEEGMARLSRIEEWEAFLSLDGGRTYPFRVTPHLTAADSRVLFRVPQVESGEARLLLRFGDEREEHSVDVPSRFSILAAGSVPAKLPVEAAVGRGESARPDEPGTLYWVEGDRFGRGLRVVVSRGEETWVGSRAQQGLWTVCLAAAPLPAAPELEEPTEDNAPVRSCSAFEPQAVPSAPLRSLPVLELHQRLNT